MTFNEKEFEEIVGLHEAKIFDGAWQREATLIQMVRELRKEVRYLRFYGSKDCTAMADIAMDRNELEEQPK